MDFERTREEAVLKVLCHRGLGPRSRLILLNRDSGTRPKWHFAFCGLLRQPQKIIHFVNFLPGLPGQPAKPGN